MKNKNHNVIILQCDAKKRVLYYNSKANVLYITIQIEYSFLKTEIGFALTPAPAAPSKVVPRIRFASYELYMTCGISHSVYIYYLDTAISIYTYYSDTEL